jgi:hypothetical protein
LQPALENRTGAQTLTDYRLVPLGASFAAAIAGPPGRTLFPRTRHIDRQCTALEFFAVEFLNRFVRFLCRGKLHKSETT